MKVLFRIEFLRERIIIREGELVDSSLLFSEYKDFFAMNSRASSPNSIKM
jgi:hypothetical protein